MKIIVSIDDTDNLEKGRGTGELAEEIRRLILDKGYGKCERVTRHQLLLHEDIPYTSHNSSMCFAADIGDAFYADIIEMAGCFLDREHAPESDPGLCVVDVDRLRNRDAIITFGRNAKKIILTKEQAYRAAQENGAHLSEHGGTGLGVIGALAGAGLRLGGNDGEIKGSISIAGENKILDVSAICASGEADAVMTTDGRFLPDDALVRFGRLGKTMHVDGRFVLLVTRCEKPEAHWKTCSKEQLRAFDNERSF